MTMIKGMELKSKFVSSARYYNKYFTFFFLFGYFSLLRVFRKFLSLQVSRKCIKIRGLILTNLFRDGLSTFLYNDVKRFLITREINRWS